MTPIYYSNLQGTTGEVFFTPRRDNRNKPFQAQWKQFKVGPANIGSMRLGGPGACYPGKFLNMHIWCILRENKQKK